MNNYDYLGTNGKHHRYPLKIYLSHDNTVVVMYTGALYNNDFEIQNTMCVISKSYFYGVIDKLKKYKTASIVDGDVHIEIKLYEKSCSIIVGNKDVTTEIKETDIRFQKWLLSIDLRKSKRVKTLIPVSLESDFSFEYGAMLDISSTGFKVALNDKLHTLDDVMLSIFDDQLPVGGVLCNIKHERVQNNKYVYGLDILEASQESEYRLREILSREEIRNK